MRHGVGGWEGRSSAMYGDLIKVDYAETMPNMRGEVL